MSIRITGSPPNLYGPSSYGGTGAAALPTARGVVWERVEPYVPYSASDDRIYWEVREYGRGSAIAASWQGGVDFYSTDLDNMSTFVQDVEKAYWRDREEAEHQRALIKQAAAFNAASLAQNAGLASQGHLMAANGLKQGLSLSSSQLSERQAVDGGLRMKLSRLQEQDEINTHVRSAAKES